MKFWIKSGGIIEFAYRDDGDNEVCERCLSEDIRGKCHKERYAVRRTKNNSDYIYCYEKSIPGKQAKHLSKITTNSFQTLVSSASDLSKNIDDIQTIAYHNAKKLNASIGQKIDSLFPSDSEHIDTNRLDSFKKIIERDLESVTLGILSVRKIIEQVEAEYNLVEILGKREPFVSAEMTSIRAHKLLVGVAYIYREVLDERNVAVYVHNTPIILDVDYSVAKSSIGQVLSNAAKYCKADSRVEVTVNKVNEYFEIVFAMTSLYFSSSEADSLGNLRVRGAQANDAPGDGVGLYAVGLFQKMHRGYLKLQSNERTKFTSGGKEYSQNELTLGFFDYGGAKQESRGQPT